jgi:hypothetical protein
MAKKRLGGRADPQMLRTLAEDDPSDARPQPADVDLHVTVDETTEWKRRRAKDTAVTRWMLRWTRIGAIAAIIGIILVPAPSQKDEPLTRTTSGTSLQQTGPEAMMPAAQQAGSRDAETLTASPQLPSRKNAAGSLARNKASSTHGGTDFNFVTPSPFSSDNDVGGTP